MKKRFLWWVWMGALLCFTYLVVQKDLVSEPRDQLLSEDSLPLLVPKDQHLIEAQASATLLAKLHYKQLDLDDSLSSVAFENFLARIDGAKIYFTAPEIENLKEKYAEALGGMIRKGQLRALYDLYALYRTRALEYVSYTEACIQKGFDFTQEEYLNADFEKRPWPKDRLSMQERWRKIIKNEALNLALTGKEKEEAQKILLKRRHITRTWLERLNAEDVFQDLMSALTSAFDPHSNYFSAINAENFNIEMSKSLEGIGARLTQEVDYTVISSLVPGGPAFKSKALEPTDRIVGVAEGDTGALIDIVGWRITEVVQLIRGKKGTVVRLFILPAQAPPDGKQKEVRLVRDKIKLEEALATQETHHIKRHKKSYNLGVISLPSFYVDWAAAKAGEKDYRSATKDVKSLLEELKTKKVEGIVIDLRKNGGGALSEAVQLTGLFIKEGPVVKVQDYEKKTFVQGDEDPSVAYRGPLVVLVDRFSASASEIFAGAMQDYNRGLITGEPTFGKGSVQNIIQLQDYLPRKYRNNKKVGDIKLTFAQYYRVSGSSTQKKGVIPDVIFPSRFDLLEYREAEHAGALPWDTIKPLNKAHTNHTAQIDPTHRKNLQNNLKEDLQDPRWTTFVSEAEQYKANKIARTQLSLHYETRKTENQKNNQTKPEPKKEKPLDKDHYLRQSLWLLADMVQAQKNIFHTPKTAAKPPKKPKNKRKTTSKKKF